MERLRESYLSLSMQIRVGILLLLIAGAGYTSYADFIEPAEADLAAAKAEDEALSNEVFNLSKTGQSIVAVEAELRKTDEELASLLESLPTEPGLERVLGTFATTAKETGVELTQFVPGDGPNSASSAAAATAAAAPPPSSPAAPAVPKKPGDPLAPETSLATGVENIVKSQFRIVAIGTYPQIVSFFDRTLGMPRILRLVSFRMKRHESESKSLAPSPKLLVEANFTAFTQIGVPGGAPQPSLIQISPIPGADSAATRLPVSSDGKAPDAANNAPTEQPKDASLSAKPLGGENK